MDEKLPEKVDVIVLGTGLPEAVLASACARSGLSVLHLDRSDYYGAEWSSFNMTTIDDFLKQSETDEANDETYLKLLDESETYTKLADRRIFENVESGWIRKDNLAEGEQEEEEKLKNSYRRFSIDLLPKVLLSRGAMVQTLCDSQVSQYAEFKLVDRQLCPLRNEENNSITLNRVPCSKGEIFTSTALTMMEKRALMKFITFCTQWMSKPEDEKKGLLGDFVDKPFGEFLKSMGVETTLQNYIINTIGILKSKPTTFDGMKASCQFMDSVGHFGPSPFLFPLYGCGELAQCFCRLAAVFGSLYCLGRPVQGLIMKNEKAVGIIADNQRVNCEHVFLSSRYVPEKYETTEVEKVERIIYITNKSIMTEEKEHISLINLASLRPEANESRIIEGGYETCIAPKGYYLLHATGSSENNAEPLKKVLDEILEQNEISPIWKLHFQMNALKFDRASTTAGNLIVCPTFNASIDYAAVIDECREIFCQVWPDRDFLPRSIKSEEIEEQDDEESLEGVKE